MPIYDYKCDSCQEISEVMQSIVDLPLEICPKCNQKSLKRLISGASSIRFNGDGFYINDSKKNDSKSK